MTKIKVNEITHDFVCVTGVNVLSLTSATAGFETTATQSDTETHALQPNLAVAATVIRKH